MSTNDKKFEEMLLELKAYVDELNKTLAANIKKSEEQNDKIANLIGEPDANSRQ